MTEIEKLRALLPHWIEHNKEHATELVRWADVAESAGHQAAAERIRQAIRSIQQANTDLEAAVNLLGGPLHLHAHEH